MNISNLDKFTIAYLAAALWSSTDDNGNPLDNVYGINDFPQATLDRAIADCEKFQAENGIPVYAHPEYDDAEMAGHDFWLTRNNHGVGFWDRDQLSEADQTKYTKAAHDFGTCDLYTGDDKQLYFC